MVLKSKNVVRRRKTLCFKPVNINLEDYETMRAAIDDVRETLKGTNVPNDGVFIEVNNQLAYAWLYDPKDARLMKGDGIDSS